VRDGVALYDLRQPPDETLLERLVQSGFLTRRSTRLDDGEMRAQGWTPRCIVVRPREAGDVRALSGLDAPVIAICPRDEALVVQALEAGADSVAVEPVSRLELEARIAALMRAGKEPPRGSGVYTIGGITIDEHGYSATRDGRRVALTPTEFRVLCCLARRAGRPVSMDAIAREVLGSANGAGARSAGFHVRGLRRKLFGVADLVYRRGAGYRLVLREPGEGVDDGYGGFDQACGLGHTGARGGLRAKRPLAPVGASRPDAGRARVAGGGHAGRAAAAAGAGRV